MISRITAELSDEKVVELKKRREDVFFKSKFNFLNEHRGLRPGALHLLLGTSGSGKSSLVRSILKDIATRFNNQEKLLCWLSEESKLDFLTEFVQSNYNKSIARNINIISELEMPEEVIGQSQMELLYFKHNLSNDEHKIIFIDNITTSKFYNDRSPVEQSNFIMMLKGIAKDRDIPIVLVAHTKHDVSDNMSRLITENDIRGNKSIVNIVQFQYILQRFKGASRFYPTIRTVKHRGQNPNDKLFYLEFSKEKLEYVSDKKIEFELFKQVFKEREHF